MPEPKRVRAEAALDDVSDHLGVVLQRADELLAQWSAFGTTVRGQVEREASTIGNAVAGAVDTAVARATSAGIDRAITDQVGTRLTALTAEIARLEARTRAAARSITDERMGDRRMLWIVVAGIALANGLLVAMLLRRPTAAPVAEPTKVEWVAPPGAAPPPAPAKTDEPEADAPSSNEPIKPPPPADSGKPGPTGAPIKTAPGARPTAALTTTPLNPPGAANASANVLNASVPGVKVPTAAKLPPRPLQRK